MAEPDERFCHSIGRIEITLIQAQSESMWEIIEDKIGDALADLGFQGELNDSVTGNSIQFGEHNDQV